ncbi:potassium channel subfamily K member 5b [Denticeps clupeoides]|uniref:Potassium channel domain-containing protein n=1 Tax=Denticeps clupeoides TaxID=299321 RepID=A0AAY4CM08_9TELE|nr:potassium channel subfamily K member 5-like [Denticeps clupeoides]
MADKGPLLTSGIIFYLSIGAAIFQLLEEPNLQAANDEYDRKLEEFVTRYPCLEKENLDEIVKAVKDAAGQGVSIASKNHFESWNWQNSLIFAATVITTIGYGNVAPKTSGGRIFYILYGLCGIPLCLTWISEMGTFFSGRAKRLSQLLIQKDLSARKIQFICTALFLLWGLLVHLIIPPFVFMKFEGWTYLEGFYFSFTTLTTVGFGDYVTGVDPDIDYPPIYRFLVEVWIAMGLAWLSLFFSWNVHMVVEAHKVLKKRRHQRRHKVLPDVQQLHEDPEHGLHKKPLEHKATFIDIFNYLTVKDEDYSDVIKKIGLEARKEKEKKVKKKVTINEEVTRSKSCNDLLSEMKIETMDHSPRLKRRFSVSEKILSQVSDSLMSLAEDQEHQSLLDVFKKDHAIDELCLDEEKVDQRGWCPWDSREPITQSPSTIISKENNRENHRREERKRRFTVYKVPEDDLVESEDEQKDETG